jgi:kynurenine formamidase
MRIVDLSLPINRHMKAIPGISGYDENPTRCGVLSALSEKQLGEIRDGGLETVAEPEITVHMMSRLEIVTHIGTHIDAPIHFSTTAGRSTKCRWTASSSRVASSRRPTRRRAAW